MPNSPVSRRSFLVSSASALAGACALSPFSDPLAKGSPRLSVRPPVTPSTPASAGLRPLGLGNALADGVVYAPPTYTPSAKAPLVLLLHGAGGSASPFITGFQADADRTNAILLAVDSRKTTWDGVAGEFGPDIDFLDLAIRDTLARYAVDTTRISVCGFSAGATMALAVGLANGGLFSRVTAFSAGGLLSKAREGKPRVFVAHGTYDPVIPVGVSSGTIVPDLRRDGYDVTYREFAGAHVISGPILSEAMTWMMAS